MLSWSTFIGSKTRGAGSPRLVHSLWAIALAGLGLLIFTPAAVAHHPWGGGYPRTSLKALCRASPTLSSASITLYLSLLRVY